MSKTVSLEYANAYSEVLEVLRNMSESDINKIPNDMIEMFKENSNKLHDFRYDFNKDFKEQNISKRAKMILAILFRDYWASPSQKEIIVARQNFERDRIDMQKQEKYNINNIFKKNEIKKDIKTEEIQITNYKESIIKKIINKKKKIFLKNE